MKLGDKHVRSRSPISFSVTESLMMYDGIDAFAPERLRRVCRGVVG